MKPTLKIFLFALLPVITVAVAACQDDENWKPTWALPVVKEQTLLIGDFITEEDVATVNETVKQQWNNYVEERFGWQTAIDTINVDSIAFLVLVQDKDSAYVTFGDDGPRLNSDIETKIKETLEGDSTVEDKIKQINLFLQSYYNRPQELQGIPNNLNPATKSKAITKSNEGGGNSSGNYYGGDAAIHNLLDAMIHPTDVFISAANVLSTMGSDVNYYIDSINKEIDEVLRSAQMTDSIPINLAEYPTLSSIDLAIAVKGDKLPFYFKFNAAFVDANGVTIREIFAKDTIKLDENNAPFTFQEDSEEELSNIAQQTKYVKFNVECRRNGSMQIAADVLRTLSHKGITFSVRLKIQAPMNKLTF